MIEMHLLSVQIRWMMFMRILMIAIQAEKKFLIAFGDIIVDIMANKKFQTITNCLLDAEISLVLA